MSTRLTLLVTFFLLTTSSAQTLTVFAASSLTAAFEDIATTFETQHPNADIVFNFAGSSTLTTQIIQGAPVDVFATADMAQMQVVVAAALVTNEAKVFTHNRLVVITHKDSGVRTLEDLAKPGVLLVLAEANVPVGKYSRQILENLNGVYGADFSDNVLKNLVSEEPNVKQVATKVELGEADAAFVYVTDAATLQNIRTIDIPDENNVLATYPIAVITTSKERELAQSFVDFVLSETGQQSLTKYGFLPN